MTKILAVDTSTEACSAALLQDGQLRERYEIAPQQHTKLLMPMVEALLADAGIGLDAVDAFAFGHGPGSFTGLRIATGLVQGLAMGVGRPVIGVSTLAAMSQRAVSMGPATQVAVALDARMGQIYWGAYRQDASGCVRAVIEDTLLDPDQVPVLPAGPWAAVGSGWSSYEIQLRQRSGLASVIPDVAARPHAGDIARIAIVLLQKGGGVAAGLAQPVYLRQTVAKKMTEQQK